MKRTEQREHIFKLIFGADFNEEAEQGTQAELYFEQIEGATEKDMHGDYHTASIIFKNDPYKITIRIDFRSTSFFHTLPAGL